ATLSSAAWQAPIWVSTSMQYRSSSTIPCSPRTCPSTRRRRASSCSLVAVYPRSSLMSTNATRYPQGVYNRMHVGSLARPPRRVPDVLAGLVGARARLRHLGDRAGLGAARPGHQGPLRLGPETDRLGHRPRRGLLVLLLRGHRHRQVAVP